MRKLIDADALKAWLWENKDREWADREDLHWSLRDYIDSLPDLGCARGQAHSSTQWCAEASALSEELARVKAGIMDHADALEEYRRQVWELGEEPERLRKFINGRGPELGSEMWEANHPRNWKDVLIVNDMEVEDKDDQTR